jgi:spore coat polysaccharide biosynthesis protein SpsF
VTADDPLKDPELIDRAVSLCSSEPSADYASNTLEPTFPEGLDIEVVRYDVLRRAALEAVLPSDREHVLPYIWRQPQRFKLRGFKMRPNLSHWRWTVDKPADIELMRRIFSAFNDTPLVNYRDVINWIFSNPEVLSINAGTVRNEGYIKSLSEDFGK